MSERYYKIVKSEIQSFVKKYQKNPFDFLTEYDLQSYLYSKIFDHFENENIVVKIETSGKNEPIERWKENNSRKIVINPVKTEYPAGYRFDIVIINNETLECKQSAYWHQKLSVAIEIKYHRCSFNRIPAEVKKFKADIDKLKNYKEKEKPKGFMGLSILFIQNENDDREKEFENKIFFDAYEKIDLNALMNKEGLEGLIVTGKSSYRLNDI